MKKFLTVLLVIAVMFTFSFSSAFAVTDATYTYAQAYELLDKTATDLIKAEEIKMNASTYAGTTTVGTSPDQVTISKDAAKVVFKDLFDEYCKNIKAEVKKQKDALDALYAAGTTEFKDGTTAYGTERFSTDDVKSADTSVTYGDSVITANALDAAKAEFKVVQADTLEALGKIDTTVYSSKKAVGAAESDAEIAARLVAQAITQVSGYSVAVADNIATLATKIKNIKDVYVAGEGTGNPSGALATTGSQTVDGYVYETGLLALTKVKDEVKDDAKLEYAKAKVIASLTADVNSEKASVINGLEADILAEKLKANPNTRTIAQKEAQIETAEKDYAKIIEVLTYVINFQEDWTQIANFTGDTYAGTPLNYTDAVGYNWDTTNAILTSGPTGRTFTNYTKANMIAMANAVADAKEDAELAKATIDIAGEKYIEIDNLLEDAIEDIYVNGVVNYNFASTAIEYLYHYVENDLIGGGVDGVRINTVDYDGIDSWYADGNYDVAKRAEAKAAVKAAKAAVRAAATVADAEAAFLEGYKAFDEVVTAYEHKKDFTFSNGKYAAKYKAVCAELDAYGDYKDGLYDATGKYADDAAAALADVYTGAGIAYTGKFYTKCFTDAELDAMLAEAKAAIDSIKTEKEMEEAALAIEKQIDALPKLAAVTIADKDAILTVFDAVIAHNEYETAIRSDYDVRTGTIHMLVGAIADLEELALTDAYNAIYKDGVVSVSEADAVAKLRDDYDAYYKLWNKNDNYSAFYDASTLTAGNDVVAAEADLLDAQVKEVVKMVNALPATNADEAAVKAATEAFKALGRDGQDDLYHAYYAVYSKLVDLQKLTAMDDEAAKAYVQDLSIKARSVKTSKGVKVTIKADVQELLDNGYTVEYKFYRSTKSNAKFGSPKITKTTNTYLNTSGKKGTRYYYKARLVVKNAKGEVVAITPLSQCLYATRVF